MAKKTDKKTTSKASTKTTTKAQTKPSKRKPSDDCETIDGRDGFSFGGTCGMDE